VITACRLDEWAEIKFGLDDNFAEDDEGENADINGEQ